MFDLKIGFKCNNNCVHCVVADKRPAGDLNFEELCDIIDKIPDNEGIQITGGEPSMYKTLPKILEKCKEKDHKVVIQSNGTGFADKAFLDECKKNIDHVHIAIHSCYPEIHDKIVQSKGMWEKTMKGFDNLLKTDITLTTQTVLSRLNTPSLYDTFTYIQNIAPGIEMSMTYPHVMGNAYLNKEQIIFRYSEFKDEFQKTLSKYKDYIFTEAIPPCYLYPNFPAATAEKDIMSRRFVREGVDFSESKKVKDYNMLDIENKKKAPKCKECMFNNCCIGVWKEYIEQFKNCLDLYPIKKEDL